MKMVTHEDSQHCMPDDKLEMTEDYKNDPLAWYNEHAIGHVKDGVAYSFWGLAQCEVDENSDLIAVCVALAAAETACGK